MKIHFLLRTPATVATAATVTRFDASMEGEK